MEKHKKKIQLIIGLLVSVIISATSQDFQGIATYQSSKKMGDFSIDGGNISPEMQAKIHAQMQKQFQKEYELRFNLNESVWTEVESLEGGPASSGNRIMLVSISSADGVTYKNTAGNKYIRETEVFSKPFLVKDDLKYREWEITDETKTIGSYQVQKAVFTEIKESKSITFSNDSDNQEDSPPRIVMDTIKIVAWYAPQIPVSHGPADYWGLPGLILEISDGSLTFMCTKIVLNPEENVKIKIPSKGKVVSRNELNAEIDAKTEEMAKKFSQERSNGKNVHKIKIKN